LSGTDLRVAPLQRRFLEQADKPPAASTQLETMK